MKTIKTTIGGVGYYLFYNAEAMFQMQELLPDEDGIGSIFENTREAFVLTVKAAVILAEQGELARRMYGYDKGEMPDPETALLMLTAKEAVQLKYDVADAILLGLERETVGEDNVVDLGLQELEKKTARG